MALCLGKISLLKPTVFKGQNAPKGNNYTNRKTNDWLPKMMGHYFAREFFVSGQNLELRIKKSITIRHI